MLSNSVIITGMIVTNFYLNHEKNGEKFYQFYLSVAESDDAEDVIPIIVSDEMIDVREDALGKKVTIIGEYRSIIKREYGNGISHLYPYVFPSKIFFVEDELCKNDIFLRGILCNTPEIRDNRMGRKEANVLVRIDRETKESDYFPCVACGKNAFLATEYREGDDISLAGKIKSRDYNLVDSILTGYEVSIEMMEHTSLSKTKMEKC